MNRSMTQTGQTGPPVRLVLAAETIGAEQLLSLTYSAGCSSSSASPSLGGAVAATVRLELAGELPELENERVRVEVGIPDGAGETVWQSLGDFRFETPETGEGKTTVTAADAMLFALERSYVPSAGAGSTALSILADLCAQAGVELADTEELEDVPVSGTLTGYTMREMAGYLAGLLGRNALFDADGRLALRWFAASGVEITPDGYYAGGFVRKDKPWAIAGLLAATGSGEEDQLTAGETAGTVLSFGNPFLTQRILSGIWARLEGFTFQPGEVSLPGDLRIEPGDLVTVTDLAGVSHTLAVMAVEHQYDGGWKTKLSSYGAAEGDTGAHYQGPATTTLTRYAAEFGSFRKLCAQDFTAVRADIEDLSAGAVRASEIFTEDLAAVEISATRYLTGVNIVGDVIQAGTLTADKLLLTGPDGVLYELNAQAGTLTETQLTDETYQQRLDGSVLAAHSVTADRINVTDLFAQDITATGTISGVHLEGATGAFTGSVTANTGRIGGWTVGEQALFCETEHGLVELYPLVGREIVNDPQAGVILPQSTILRVRGYPDINASEAQAASLQDFFAVNQDGLVDLWALRTETFADIGSWLAVHGDLSVSGNAAVTGSLSTYGYTVPRIQHGRLTISVDAGVTSNFFFTFPRAFPGTPTVVLTPQHPTASPGASMELHCNLTSVNDSRVEGRFFYTNGGTWTIHWMAMYG